MLRYIQYQGGGDISVRLNGSPSQVFTYNTRDERSSRSTSVGDFKHLNVQVKP